MNQIGIVGYEENGHCEHCGRALRHCIKLNDGRIVGATCFDKKLTLPISYNGTKYRLGAERIVFMAKAAEFWGPRRQMQAGLYPHQFIFDAAAI